MNDLNYKKFEENQCTGEAMYMSTYKWAKYIIDKFGEEDAFQYIQSQERCFQKFNENDKKYFKHDITFRTYNVLSVKDNIRSILNSREYIESGNDDYIEIHIEERDNNDWIKNMKTG